jgi:hypothetical protein
MNEDNRNIYAAIIKMAVKTARAITDDQEALAVKCLYKQWEKQIGRQLEVGEYIQHNKQLYRVLQQHIAQVNWIPGEGTESLYVIIDKEHSGAENDPIPWKANMECFNGKYYIEDGILYLCVRDSGIALQCKIVDVLGNYFKLANEEEKEEEPIEPPVEEPKEDEGGEDVPPTDEGGEDNGENNGGENTEGGEVVEPEEPKEEEGEDEVVAELGTKENPIPYVISNTPMENGKYYIEEGVVYLCNRSEAVLHHPLSALVGLYVVIAE